MIAGPRTSSKPAGPAQLVDLALQVGDLGVVDALAERVHLAGERGDLALQGVGALPLLAYDGVEVGHAGGTQVEPAGGEPAGHEQGAGHHEDHDGDEPPPGVPSGRTGQPASQRREGSLDGVDGCSTGRLLWGGHRLTTLADERSSRARRHLLGEPTVSKPSARKPTVLASGYETSITRTVIAALLVVLGIVWMAVYFNVARDAAIRPVPGLKKPPTRSPAWPTSRSGTT